MTRSSAERLSITLRPMTEADLPLVGRWLLEPHVARWWTEDPADELADYRRCVDGSEPTRALMICVEASPVGWCQWYRWADYPEAPEYGALADDVGLDYAIGAPDQIGHGVGTAMIGALVADVRATLPGAPLLVCVDALNTASRRVLEKNGFALTDYRDIPSEPEDQSALYRLPGASVGDLGTA
jgi:aminoglycoside 6'-N-acetyltransferase